MALKSFRAQTSVDSSFIGLHDSQSFVHIAILGEVYLAEERRAGATRQVAIKTIRVAINPRADQATIQPAEQRFQREMQAIFQLDHPGILPLYDFGEERIEETMLTYTVMPFRSEGSLADWLQRQETSGRLTLEETAHFVGQAAQALQHVHEYGLIHQNVKPANFLLRARSDQALPDLLLADFGITQSMAFIATPGQDLYGTPAYMAPEQWKGHPIPATDQYALAIIAYSLLTHSYPFTGDVQQVMHQHLNVPPPGPSTFNPAISYDLDAVLLQALRKTPEDRFASITTFANVFQQVVDQQVRGVPSSPVRPLLAEQGYIPRLSPHGMSGSYPSTGMPSIAKLPQAVFPGREASMTGASSPSLPGSGDIPFPTFPQSRPTTNVPPPSSGPFKHLVSSGAGKVSRSRIWAFTIACILVLFILSGATWVLIQRSQTHASQTHAGLRVPTQASPQSHVRAGQVWHAQSSGTSQFLFSIVWTGSQFVVVGDHYTILTSPDGSTWTPQNSHLSPPSDASPSELNGIAWSGSAFVVVGNRGTILTSPDGVNWTTQETGTLDLLQEVVWSGSQFVITGERGDGSDAGMILTSPDGINWTAQNPGVSNYLDGIAWSGSQFVVVGGSGTILTSPDGTTWTAQNAGTPNNLYGVTWASSQFIVVGDNGTILTSPDGSTWTPQKSGTSLRLTSPVWSGSQFVVVGFTILTSPDGSTWTTQNPGTYASFDQVVWSGSQFVAVGNEGKIITSS